MSEAGMRERQYVHLVMGTEAADGSSWVINVWRSKEDAESAAKNYGDRRTQSVGDRVTYTVLTKEVIG